MKILGIETSTFAGSVALLDDYKLLGEYTFNIGPKHNEKLVPSIDYLLSDLQVDKKELDAIAVTVGPGSFTSLRVGVSTAKALSYSLNIKVVGVSSLEVLAYPLFGCEFQICTIIDAKKKQLFSGLYKNSYKLQTIKDESLVYPDELFESIKEKTVFVGNGAEVYKDQIIDSLGDKAVFPGSVFNVSRASSCVLLGKEKLLNGIEDDCINLSPIYMRKSEAELKRKK